jgi:hypothetical protein
MWQLGERVFNFQISPLLSTIKIRSLKIKWIFLFSSLSLSLSLLFLILWKRCKKTTQIHQRYIFLVFFFAIFGFSKFFFQKWGKNWVAINVPSFAITPLRKALCISSLWIFQPLKTAMEKTNLTVACLMIGLKVPK